MTKLKYALVLLALLLPAMALAQEQNRMVAVVGNDIITQLDLEKAMNRMESQLLSSAPNQPRPSREEIRQVALETLIESMVFKQVLDKEGLTMSDEDVDRQVQAILERSNISEHELAAELSLRGITMQEYREEMRLEVLKRRLIDRRVRGRVVISDEQVLDYYYANAGQLRAGDMHLKAIFLAVPSDPKGGEQMRELAQKIYRELKAGGDFAKLAQEFSQGPGAAAGGDLGTLNITDMLPTMRAAVENLKPGEISQPIALPDNYVIFQRAPDATTSAGTRPEPTDSERRQIREILEKEALDKRFQEWMGQVRSEVYVKIIDN